MATLELIADQQAELVSGGGNYNAFGAISPILAPFIGTASYTNYGIQFSNVAGSFFMGPLAGVNVTSV